MKIKSVGLVCLISLASVTAFSASPEELSADWCVGKAVAASNNPSRFVEGTSSTTPMIALGWDTNVGYNFLRLQKLILPHRFSKKNAYIVAWDCGHGTVGECAEAIESLADFELER